MLFQRTVPDPQVLTKFDPSKQRLVVPVPAPPRAERTRVLSSVVAPWRVNAPGVLVDPIVLTDEAPEPKVLVEAPVPRVVEPEEVNVVTPLTAPALILTELIVLVVLAVMVEVKVKRPA
jgi:hypothetical protein